METLKVLDAIRRKILKIIVIFILFSSISFAFLSNQIVHRMIEDLYPSEAIIQDKERLLIVSKELLVISEDLRNYATYPSEENRTLALNAAKNLTRISSYLMTSPILKSPLEALLLNLKISAIFGVLATLPYVLKIVHGSLKERFNNVSLAKYSLLGFFLFLLGIIYGYYMMKFFLNFLYSLAVQQGAVPLYGLSEFVNFVFLMILLFGFVFELPVLMFFLVKNKFVKYETLVHYRRHLYVLFFVIGAILTPPDVFTQLMVAIPLVVFFEISLLVIKVAVR
ncbi:MAG: twin-arginine translocase subunit TatC [Archaeoglobaceae archaeon]|nr:twin-arginine translocase subunit TatC [Archaeoglobaceae archaeon]MDW8013369.1 twin-arginine translocase subunit TatC [Archaeoglobaceae archaeon]